MKTKPTAKYRHSGRGGHADRMTYHRTAKRPAALAEAERIGSRAVESIRAGLVEIAGGQARRAAQIAFSLTGRE